MASNELFDTGIKVTGSFSAAGAFPVDGKYIVDTIAERDDHVTQNRAYDGMQVYVKADGVTYQYHQATNSWSVFHDDKMYSHAVTNKGIASGEPGEGENISPGFYKIITNQEGHVVSVEKVTKEDIKSLGVAITDTTYTVGGNTLGLVKNGGNVTINNDGTMTAPTVSIPESIQPFYATYPTTSWKHITDALKAGRIIQLTAVHPENPGLSIRSNLVSYTDTQLVFSSVALDGLHYYTCDSELGWSYVYKPFATLDDTNMTLTDASGNVLIDNNGFTLVGTSNNTREE